MSARVTICLPVLNGAAYLEDALASLERQTFRDFKIVASDNGSTDLTGEMLLEWKTRLPLDIIRREPRVSMVENFNGLIGQVDSDYYMLLCHDDFLADENALADAVAVLDDQPDVSAIYCDLLYVDEKGRKLATRRFQRRGRMDADDLGQQCLATARNLFGIPLLIRTRDLGSHRYDPALSYVCDIDLSWSISEHNPAYHIERPLIANRYTGGNHTWSLLRLAGRQFQVLATKHGVRLDFSRRCRLWFVNWIVMQQKRLFGLYARWKGRCA